ncbi:MAG TPA: cytochrome P450 [Solirubrobacterales bacterium]|nr:cytochrome P450 [Solirubrobacterales bacterium]
MTASAPARAELPAGPELSPLRQASRWIADPIGFMRSQQRRFGDVFTMRLPQEEPWVIVGDPELVKQVFTAPDDALYAGGQKRVLRPIMGASSVLLTDGTRHMRTRRLLLPPFHRARIGRYEETMRAVVEEELERWPTGTPAPAGPRMSAIAMEVILRTVFGLGDDQQRGPLREALARLMSYATGSRSALVAFADSARLREDRFSEFRRLLGRAEELLLGEVDERRRVASLEERDDMLSLLLRARFEDGSPLSDTELRDQLMTLLVAGHETVAASLAWGVERLARHPEALSRASAEAVRGGDSHPYMDAVVRETLRVRPVLMVVPRLVRKPFQLGDRVIPEGAAVTPSIPLVHLNPDVYPEPDAFRPERFLDRQPGTYAWIPFGGGIRRCIGAGFSLLEMRVVLSTLLARFSLQATDDGPEPAKRRLLVVTPAAGANVVLEPR